MLRNYTTAVHILGHEDKCAIFSEKDKIKLKNGKNAQKHTKNREIFYHF